MPVLWPGLEVWLLVPAVAQSLRGQSATRCQEIRQAARINQIATYFMITPVRQVSFPTPLLSYTLVSTEVDMLADESFPIDFIFILNQRSPAKPNRLRRNLQKFEIPILFDFFTVSPRVRSNFDCLSVRPVVMQEHLPSAESLYHSFTSIVQRQIQRDGAYSSKLELRSEERDCERESALLNRGLRYILNGIAV